MDIFKDELTILWEVVCPRCGSEILNKNGKYRGRQRFICLDCGLSFTTYSRSILDSTKLTPKQWEIIIESIINNEKLESISKKALVSIISLSKIRRKILDELYSLSRYNFVLNKYYYNPFDTSTIFIPNKNKGTIYYHEYNNSMVIACIKYHNDIFISNAYFKKDFNILMSDINYSKLEFVSASESSNLVALYYLENLLSFLKQYRGIKNDLLAKYCNFYDFQKNLSKEELINLIINQIGRYKKKK